MYAKIIIWTSAQYVSAHHTSRQRITESLLFREERPTGARLDVETWCRDLMSGRDVGASVAQNVEENSEPPIAGLTEARAGLRLIL